VHHRTFQINHQPDATVFQFIILTFVYSSTCFGRFPAHHQELNDCSGSLWFYLPIVVTVVLCSWSGQPIQFHFVLYILISIGFCLVILHSSSFVILSVHFIFIIRLKYFLLIPQHALLTHGITSPPEHVFILRYLSIGVSRVAQSV